MERNDSLIRKKIYKYMLQAAAILLGSGGAVTVAILLGKRDMENAGKVMGFCMLLPPGTI